MAAVTLETLSGENRPAFSPGTEVAAFTRFVDVRGPYKVEILYFQCDVDDSFTDADTFNSQLAHPMFATVVMAGRDGANDSDITNLTVTLDSLETSANFRQLVLHDADGTDGTGVVITVYGF